MLILLGVWAIGYLVPSLLLGILLNTQLPSWLAFGHVYVLFGVYFTWYWTKTGQTLAMQTWKVKMVDENDLLLKRNQALIRYAISSLWLIPTV
ncbi:MAG: RDD family protein, partial [Myxococcaceae bacterium]